MRRVCSLDVRAIPDRLSIYVDQRVAPGGSNNSEAYARLWFHNQRFYVKAGQMYPAVRHPAAGRHRLHTSGDGHQLRDARPRRRSRLRKRSLDGSTRRHQRHGGRRGHTERQAVQPARGTRAVDVARGASFNLNDSQDGATTGGIDIGKRQMQGVFAGLRTGPIAWLAEADYIIDDTLVPNRKQKIVPARSETGLVRQGHNLKLTGNISTPTPSLTTITRDRWSIVYEYTPIQFAQFRAGFRNYDGIPPERCTESAACIRAGERALLMACAPTIGS